MGSLVISLGPRRANESRQLGGVVEALRFLSQGGRQKRAILSRAKLLAAEDERSIVDEIFREAGLSAEELLYFLKIAVNEGRFERDRIREIAAVAPSLPNARGRKMSAASAAHEEFLRFARRFGSFGYTCSNEKEDLSTSAPKPNLTPRILTRDPPISGSPAKRPSQRAADATRFSGSSYDVFRYRRAVRPAPWEGPGAGREVRSSPAN
jgi:hypothetical protein